MKRYITAAAFALTAALCCSCSEKKNDGNGSSEMLTTAEITTEVQTTATEAAATTTSVTITATVTERVVTTVKSADELSFTKEDLYALDPAVLCKDSRRRSGEHYEERYSEVSDSYESHLYRFCIDEDAQIAWSTQRDLKDHTMSMETFDYIKTGRYDEKLGPLNSLTTNQRMIKRLADGRVKDITNRFQKTEVRSQETEV